MLWFDLFLLLLWGNQARSSENTFCLFICSFDPFLSCLHARAHLTLKRTHQQFSGTRVQCFHLAPPLPGFHFFSSFILNSAYNWNSCGMHRVGIQISCRVIKILSYLDRIAVNYSDQLLYMVKTEKKNCKETLVDLILFHGQRQMTGLF